MKLPDHIPDEAVLDEMLSRPTPDVNDFIKELEGDIMILGAAGKIGVSLARMAARAVRETGVRKKVIAVDLFDDELRERMPRSSAARVSEHNKNKQLIDDSSQPGCEESQSVREDLDQAGVETIRCNLLNRSEVSRLPRAGNVIYMAGKKFGTESDQELTWAINVLAPDYVADHFSRSGIVVYSTGCVYPLVSPDQGGCREDTPPRPVGEYAQSCLGRERVFSYYSKTFGTRICLYRLNYSIDLRYGVLHDIGMKVYHCEPVELAVSHFNCIWQGDANRLALLCLGHCATPPAILNITGPETISVKETAQKFARYFNKEVEFKDEQVNTNMYLSDASKSTGIFGSPSVPLDKLIQW